jgi:hypothetical protein
MRKRVLGSTIAGAVAAALIALVALPSEGQQAAAYRGPRTPDGKPNLTGLWQALTEANWDLEPHAARPGPSQYGALFAEPGGVGIVEGNKIPYKPAAVAKKNENFAKRWTEDPEAKCYMPGVPRATYMPFPFQIVQSTNTVLMAYEFASASRVIKMNSTSKSPVPSWMGWSIGRWEGDTLVVDVSDFTDQTWFDRAGNYHSDALHVVERYVPKTADLIVYEATIEDPQVFTRPWKISLPLHRRVDRNAQFVEFKCVPFSEELIYGHLRKKASE